MVPSQSNKPLAQVFHKGRFKATPFLIFINDLEGTTNYFSVRLFAEDISLTACGKDLDMLIQRINLELAMCK